MNCTRKVIRSCRPVRMVPGLLLAALVLLDTGVAQAQGRARLSDVNERLIRVENVLDKSLLEMLQQVQSLQSEVRQLRGELENVNYALDQARQELGRIPLLQARMAELEQRLELLGQPVMAAESDGTDGEGVNAADDEVAANALPAGPALTTGAAQSGSNLGGTREGSTATTSIAGPDNDAAAVNANSIAVADYQAAFALVKQGQYAEGITAFDRFLGQHGSHALASNAWYWQGEAMYARRNFDDAVANFQILIDTYPGSEKVPAAELKIGYSLYEQGLLSEAREQLEFVRKRYARQPVAGLASERLQQLSAANQ